jgi:hypothetical protein
MAASLRWIVARGPLHADYHVDPDAKHGQDLPERAEIHRHEHHGTKEDAIVKLHEGNAVSLIVITISVNIVITICIVVITIIISLESSIMISIVVITVVWISTILIKPIVVSL